MQPRSLIDVARIKKKGALRLNYSNLQEKDWLLLDVRTATQVGRITIEKMM